MDSSCLSELSPDQVKVLLLAAFLFVLLLIALFMIASCSCAGKELSFRHSSSVVLCLIPSLVFVFLSRLMS